MGFALAYKIDEGLPAREQIVRRKIIRLEMKVGIGDRTSRAIDQPNVPRRYSIKRADGFECKTVPPFAIGLHFEILLTAVDHCRRVGAGGKANTQSLAAANRISFDVNSARVFALENSAIRVA